MKYFSPLAFTLFCLTFTAASQPSTSYELNSEPTENTENFVSNAVLFNNNKPETPIWSEDFANGIPASWTNVGTNGVGAPYANALWEYRGTATTPSNASGSRGNYSGVNNTPPNNSPILSPSASNGFVIFDSDWRANNGILNGAGTAPPPHKSSLTSTVINLSANPKVELRFNSYYRYYAGKAIVSFSTDGGITWPHSVTVHSNINVNASSARNAVVSINATPYIGNAANARIRFTFDGTIGSNPALYFWMIDDIELSVLQKHDIRFTAWQGAPAQDAIFGPANGSSKTGSMVKNIKSDQTRDITFDVNAVNFGWGALNNVKLLVHIFDSNNLLVSTYQSTPGVAILPGDTANYNQLNTYATPWNPSVPDTYKIVYSLTSDSAQTIYADTVKIRVSPSQMSNDFGGYHNQMGTSSLGNNGSAMASRIDFVQTTLVESVWIGLGGLTIPGGTVQVRVLDSAGYTPGFGFSGASIKLISGFVTITAAHVAAGYVIVPFATPLAVPAYQGYYFAVYMNSNNGANRISIKNDQTFPQPAMSKLMYSATDAAWYTGYANSLSFNAPWIRPVLENVPSITASGPLVFCDGQNVQLSAPNGLNSYLWNTGDTTSAIYADTAGTYFVILEDNGLFDTLPPVTVTVLPQPLATISILQGAATFCLGDSVMLVATIDTGLTYQWLLNGTAITGETNDSLVTSIAGDYAVKVTNAGNCFNTSADTTIVVLPLPDATINVIGSTTFCQGDSVLLSAPLATGITYQWYLNGNPIANAVQANYAAKQAGNYTVEVASAALCTNLSSPVAVSTQAPVVTSSISGPANVFPALQYSYSVTQNGTNTYNWVASNGFVITGQGTNSVNVIWNSGNNCLLTVTESNGSCQDTSSFAVLANMAIEEDAAGLASILCYPNPADKEVVILFKKTPFTTFELFVSDVSGRTVIQQHFDGNVDAITVNTENLNTGVYMLTIPQFNTRFQLIVKHE